MANQQQVVELYRRHPALTVAQAAERLGCRPSYIRATAQRLKITLPGALVPFAEFNALLLAVEAIRDGLADTNGGRGDRLMLITKAEAFAIADAASRAGRAAR
jgi:hypothetical protein